MNNLWISTHSIQLSTVFEKDYVMIKASYKSGINVGEVIVNLTDGKEIVSKVFVHEDFRNLGLGVGMIDYFQSNSQFPVSIHDSQDEKMKSFLNYYLSFKK